MNITSHLQKISFENRIPLYSIFELTYRCNLKCLHCYIPPQKKYKQEITTSVVKKIINEIASLGGLYLVFTGGEPLLRKDIFELVEYAKKKNFVVILFTNGSLMNKNSVENLAVSGVDSVEISIYGREHIHNKFVQRQVFNNVIESIYLLKQYRIDVCLKTLLTKLNYTEFEFIKNLARNLNIRLKVDFVVTPRNDGSADVLRYTLDENRIYKFLSNQGVRLTYDRNFKNVMGENFLCSAGFNLVCVSPVGDVYPCIQLPYKLGNVKKKSFVNIWRNNDFIAKVKNFEKYHRCSKCRHIFYCSRCIGLCYIESGSLYGCSYTVLKLSQIWRRITSN
ncbi:MAG: radical SAM protein [Endomicrobia bacterium]|nr:radical SAM protein [Endomicrobiia bacterium]